MSPPKIYIMYSQPSNLGHRNTHFYNIGAFISDKWHTKNKCNNLQNNRESQLNYK